MFASDHLKFESISLILSSQHVKSYCLCQNRFLEDVVFCTFRNTFQRHKLVVLVLISLYRRLFFACMLLRA